MFERYTEKARRAIFFARYEASQFGSQWIEGQHLLLALLREDFGVFAPFLKNREAAQAIRKEIEAWFPAGPHVSTAVDLPLSAECKRALNHAAEEAQRLAHEWIAPVHQLLGLLREESGAVTEILARYGVGLETVRALAAAAPAPERTQPRPPVHPWVDERSAMERFSEALMGLSAGRLVAAGRVIKALAKDNVKIEVTSPDETFTISFGEEPADRNG
jgi:ATP-dependent Clp protease ATP-binding subunit ClpC